MHYIENYSVLGYVNLFLDRNAVHIACKLSLFPCTVLTQNHPELGSEITITIGDSASGTDPSSSDEDNADVPSLR